MNKIGRPRYILFEIKAFQRNTKEILLTDIRSNKDWIFPTTFKKKLRKTKQNIWNSKFSDTRQQAEHDCDP